jgi:hypothetical protein
MFKVHKSDRVPEKLRTAVILYAYINVWSGRPAISGTRGMKNGMARQDRQASVKKVIIHPISNSDLI